MRFTGVSRTLRHAAIAVLAVSAAGVIAACGDAEPVEPSIDIPEGAPLVDQHGLRFDPTSLTVAAGEPVYFLNSETAPHTVTIDGDDVSGRMSRGDAIVYTFETAGEYDITCDYHPQMKATITVE